MTCANCATTIERKLRKTTGVNSAVVNLAAEQVTVDYDPQVSSFKALVEAIEKAGYRVPPLTEAGVVASAEAKQATLEEELLRQKLKLWLGIVLTSLLLYIGHERVMLLLTAQGLADLDQ